MSLTASTSHWDSTSEYHDLRASDAKPQVEKYIMPFLLKYRGSVKDGTLCDFACGAGAIAEQVVKQANAAALHVPRFLLVDVVAENIATAKARAQLKATNTKLDGFLCNGSDFSNYSGDKFSLLYCWDAMVHFDIVDIVKYISTIDRLCEGYCFFHHSNYGKTTSDIRLNPHWRNFMTKDVFRQICISSNHTVVSQQLLDWGEKDLDCITIIKVGR